MPNRRNTFPRSPGIGFGTLYGLGAQPQLVNPVPDPIYRGNFAPYTKNLQTGERSFAMPRVAQSLVDAFKLPGDVFMGRQAVDTRDPEFMGRVNNFGGIAVGGGVTAHLGSKAAATAHKNIFTRRVARELEKPDPQTTKFGRMNADLLREINKIRVQENMPEIGKRQIRIYENVLKKFQEKRLGADGLTPEQLARTAYQVVHGKSTIVERGNFPTAQRLINQNGEQADVGFVGQGPADDVSVKSIFRVNDKKALKRLRKK